MPEARMAMGEVVRGLAKRLPSLFGSPIGRWGRGRVSSWTLHPDMAHIDPAIRARTEVRTGRRFLGCFRIP